MRKLIPALTTLAMLAAPVLALAADEAHAAETKGSILPPLKQGLPAMIAAWVVLLVVLMVLSTKAWPQIQKGLSDRERKIREEIESAELARKQARDALEQYESSLRDARAEAQRMLEKARAQQQALMDEIRAKNELEINAMREKARRDIEAAKRSALADIYQAAGDLATQAASKILRREVGSGDNRRLIDESMAELAGKN